VVLDIVLRLGKNESRLFTRQVVALEKIADVCKKFDDLNELPVVEFTIGPVYEQNINNTR